MYKKRQIPSQSSERTFRFVISPKHNLFRIIYSTPKLFCGLSLEEYLSIHYHIANNCPGSSPEPSSSSSSLCGQRETNPTIWFTQPTETYATPYRGSNRPRPHRGSNIIKMQKLTCYVEDVRRMGLEGCARSSELGTRSRPEIISGRGAPFWFSGDPCHEVNI